MIDDIHVTQVGAPDPELHNSPVVEEADEDFDTALQSLPEEGQCYFNALPYADGQRVCSGAELLRCERGVWVQEGSCDPDNP